MFRSNQRMVWVTYVLALVVAFLATRWVQGRMELAADLTSVLGGTHPGLYLEPTGLWTATGVAAAAFAIAVWVVACRSLRVAMVISLAFPLATLLFWWLTVERPFQLAVHT